jgi:hypothetical protein
MELSFETERLINQPLTIKDFYNTINKPEEFINKYRNPFPKSAYGGEDNFKRISKEVYKMLLKMKTTIFGLLHG